MNDPKETMLSDFVHISRQYQRSIRIDIDMLLTREESDEEWRASIEHQSKVPLHYGLQIDRHQLALQRSVEERRKFMGYVAECMGDALAEAMAGKWK